MSRDRGDLRIELRDRPAGALYLTGFLGGAMATHYRIGSPLFTHVTHVLFGAYVAAVMWCGLVLRYPNLLAAIAAPSQRRR